MDKILDRNPSVRGHWSFLRDEKTKWPPGKQNQQKWSA